VKKGPLLLFKMNNQNNILSVLQNHSLIPVITFHADSDPIKVMEFLIRIGVSCIEVTLRTEEGIKGIKELRKHFGNTISLGAGTVTNHSQIQQLKEIGVDFMVSPGLTTQLKKEMDDSTISYLPGVSTPGEIMKAMEMGLTTLKFFPANLFGGLSALKTYGNLFPEVKFCPTGGISKETSPEYLALHNVIAVGGSWFQADFNKTLLK